MRIAGLPTSLLSLLLIVGCKNEGPSGSVTTSPTAVDYDGLYERYLTGDWETAKQSMIQLAAQGEHDESVPIEKRSHALWLAHSRLYLMEAREGHSQEAEAHWTAAKYWYLRKCEWPGNEGDLSKNLGWFTQERCAQIIEKWDNGKTAGKGPRFIQSTNAKSVDQPSP